ncbi:MAG: hypothetical protein JSV33_07190 [bacterium]|nr:MAG: hypothetical protein JSV33_07190 [bacterium]
MSGKEKSKGMETVNDSDATESATRTRTCYSVILEGVEKSIETAESFAIKFSVIARVPVSKIKHIARTTPATLWKGQTKSRALHLLSLIEEAGGVGRIVAEEVPVGAEGRGAQGAKSGSLSTCSKCGFPLKKGDTFCDFCLTSVKGTDTGKSVFKSTTKHYTIPPARLLLYLVILFVGILFLTVIR